MKQQPNLLLFLAIIISLCSTSCHKEDINIDITLHDWEVVKIKSATASSFSKTQEIYILSFTSDTRYSINLDVNDCSGEYQIPSKGNIIIGYASCSEACCDTDFAEDLIRLLPKMTSYYGKGEKLFLEGEGEIVLKQH